MKSFSFNKYLSILLLAFTVLSFDVASASNSTVVGRFQLKCVNAFQLDGNYYGFSVMNRYFDSNNRIATWFRWRIKYGAPVCTNGQFTSGARHVFTTIHRGTIRYLDSYALNKKIRVNVDESEILVRPKDLVGLRALNELHWKHKAGAFGKDFDIFRSCRNVTTPYREVKTYYQNCRRKTLKQLHKQVTSGSTRYLVTGTCARVGQPGDCINSRSKELMPRQFWQLKTRSTP